MSFPKISAVILAAGFSSRMSDFKPLLPLDGRTVMEHVIQTFRNAGIADVTVVAGYRSVDLIPALERCAVRHTVNAQYQEGMYSSVQAGIRTLAPDVAAFFLLPVDVPLVKPHTVRLLARDFYRNRGSVTYPVFQGQRGHPPLISSELVPLILTQNRSDGLRGLLEEQDAFARNVEWVDEGVLLDMDTPADYQKIQERSENADFPSAAECRAIFSRVGTSTEAIRHGQAVATVAGVVALALNKTGLSLNVRRLEAAALLHDVAKGRKNHARTGGRILKGMGYGQLGESISRHMDLKFSAADGVDETAVIYLADKLVRREQQVSIEERFAPAFDKYPSGHSLAPLILGRFLTAQAIAGEVEQRMGKSLTEILSLKIENGKESMSVAR